jgi:hypothetical protein
MLGHYGIIKHLWRISRVTVVLTRSAVLYGTLAASPNLRLPPGTAPLLSSEAAPFIRFPSFVTQCLLPIRRRFLLREKSLEEAPCVAIMDRSRAMLRLLRQCQAIHSPTPTRAARLKAPSQLQLRHFRWTPAQLEEPKTPGTAKTEVKDDTGFGKEKLSFRGQLYKSTSERLARERADEDRFIKSRDWQGAGTPFRAVAMSFSTSSAALKW